MAEPDLGELLGPLERHRVQYVVIGAQAAVIHGLMRRALEEIRARERGC